jgi:hypothetical protein
VHEVAATATRGLRRGPCVDVRALLSHNALSMARHGDESQGDGDLLLDTSAALQASQRWDWFLTTSYLSVTKNARQKSESSAMRSHLPQWSTSQSISTWIVLFKALSLVRHSPGLLRARERPSP